jgi:DNA-binding NarL/FixJ family response regulator
LVARLRIIIGDDHKLFRQGLRKILEERPDWEIVAEAGDGREAVRHALAMHPDVVVLDISMPLLNGIEVTRQLVRRLPQTRILILSMHTEEAYVVQALQAGAHGYLLKDSAAKELIRAIDVVAGGKSFFSPAAAKIMLDDYVKRVSEHGGVADRYDSLSEREREIFQLVAEGRSSKEIAVLLSVSPTTVETHRAHIMQKLDVHNTAELVLYAVRRGVIA